MRALALLAALAAGCTSFSSYQTARLLAPGRQSIGAALAWAEHHSAGEGFDASVLALEALYRRGLGPTLEGGVKVSHLRAQEGLGGESLTLAFVDATFGLRPDVLAFALPVGLGWRQDGLHDLQLQPSLVHTAVLAPWVHLDTTTKLIAIADEDGGWRFAKLNAALDLGLRLRSDAHCFELVVEVGVMVEDLTSRYRGDVGDSIVLGAGIAGFFLP